MKRKCISLVMFAHVTYNQSETKCRSRPSCRAPQTVARRKLTTNMPDCGWRAPDRLLSSLAMWPQWAEERFFFPFHFLSLPHRKETCCRCLRNREELPAWEGFRAHMRRKSIRVRVFGSELESLGPEPRKLHSRFDPLIFYMKHNKIFEDCQSSRS